jgi:hypothetical protein
MPSWPVITPPKRPIYPPPVHRWILDGGSLCPRSDLPRFVTMTPKPTRTTCWPGCWSTRKQLSPTYPGCPCSWVSTPWDSTFTMTWWSPLAPPRSKSWLSLSLHSGFKRPRKLLYGFDVLLSNPDSLAATAWPNYGDVWLPGWLDAINAGTNSLFLTIGPGDFLVHHAIALGLHTTTLILVKGALDARGSKLMPDKKDFGYSFPCDGPGRGGTCDISAWDAFYLAMFWMLNTIGWLTFYWHWKHLSMWSRKRGTVQRILHIFDGMVARLPVVELSQLINGYNPYGTNNLSVWAWMFLFGHLVWATGFMFLI